MDYLGILISFALFVSVLLLALHSIKPDLKTLKAVDKGVCILREGGILYAYDEKGTFLEQDRDWNLVLAHLIKRLTPGDQSKPWSLTIYQHDKDTTFIVGE